MQTLHTDDGVLLHLQHWPMDQPRGTVLVVHGLGEHIGRYAHVAAHLNRSGWNVIGYDQRGHGASGGDRGAVVHDDDLLRDLAQVIDAVHQPARGPLVLLGHSMGGLIAARFVAEELEASRAVWHRPVDALVMSSPALDPGMNAAQKALLALLSRTAPNLALNNNLKPEWISRDPAVVKAYRHDALVHDRITPRLVRFIADGGRFTLERASRWCTPTLLMWAGADRCVAPQGSAAFAAAAPKNVVSAKIWPNLFHEIFNEPEQQQVLAELTGWLAERGH